MPLPAPLHPFLSSSLLPPGFGSKMGQPLRCGRRRRGAFCGDSVAKPLPQFERERKTQLRDARIRIAILILADVPLLLKINTFYSREHICLPCTRSGPGEPLAFGRLITKAPAMQAPPAKVAIEVDRLFNFSAMSLESP